MQQRVIREILRSCYGETHQLRFLMRPQTRLAQYLIAKEILQQYATLEDAIGARPGNIADFYRAVASDIDEQLENHFFQDMIDRWRRHLRDNERTQPTTPTRIFENPVLSLLSG